MCATACPCGSESQRKSPSLDLTGRIDDGFDYTRGSDVAQSSVSAEVISRSPAYEGTLTFNAVLTVVEEQPDSSQYFLGYRDIRFLTERVFVGPWPMSKAIGTLALRSADPSELGLVIG